MDTISSHQLGTWDVLVLLKHGSVLYIFAPLKKRYFEEEYDDLGAYSILKLGHHCTWTWIIGLKVGSYDLCDPMQDGL